MSGGTELERSTALPARAAVVPAPPVGERAQGFEEDHEILLLGCRELQRRAGLAILRVQADWIEV